MKTKNLLKLQGLLLILIMSSAIITVSCKDDDDSVNVDKTELEALVTQADSLSDAATSDDYPQTAIDAYNTTLGSVKNAAASSSLTQEQADNLVVQLTSAIETLKSQEYEDIDEALNLNAGWHFDEGTGTTATAFSTVQHVATFTAGNASIFGAEAMSPTWVEGLNGGFAISLDKGAHLEVPYNNKFLPADLSISVWIKPNELYENNYILSQNFWNGYKLQTQGGGKPFFTYKKVDGGIIDADNEMDNSIVAGQWNHIIITLDGTAKELKFYVNGVLTKTWTESNKSIGPMIQTLTSPDPQPFIIGCVATDAQIATWEWTETPSSLGYFKGIIDELKIYNIALSEGQITRLHNHEKP